MSPENSHAEKMGVLVNTILQWLLAYYVFSFWGPRPQIPTSTVPVDPTGGLLSPVPILSPPKQISGYAPVLYVMLLETLRRCHSAKVKTTQRIAYQNRLSRID